MKLIFLFFVYSFGGWILEGIFNRVTVGSFSKDNFLKLPIKPMYGISMILLVTLASLYQNWVAIVFGSFIIPSLVEFTTGTLLELHTGRKWWDYSSMKFNLAGHVCLVFSFSWMVLSIFVIYFIQPLLATAYSSAESLFVTISILLTFVFIFDSIVSITRHNCRRKPA